MKKLLSDITIELHVPDFELAKEFYGDLGFDVVWEKKSQPNKKGYMVMRRGSSIINFYCGDSEVYKYHFFSKFYKDFPRGYALEIVVPIDDIQDFYQAIQKKYPKKIERQLNKKYEKLDFRMTDPFGFFIS